MVRLGHIDYSNCFPVHCLLLDRGLPEDIVLRTGVPADLNRWLATGGIDVAPASSIEFARNAERYRLMPDLVIGARGAVGSILLESVLDPADLDGHEVAVPTASATSVVLLRLLLERRLGVRPRYRWFDQTREDPIRAGAAATLWIGDVALRRASNVHEREQLDLGAAWAEWTGLPFAFALWQISAGTELDTKLQWLHGLLLESRAFFYAELDALAQRHAAHFSLPPSSLSAYWRSLDFELDEEMQRGLLHFYHLAAELAETPPVSQLRWL
jgi:chorismate dehydratase